jgi:hypothetical protein
VVTAAEPDEHRVRGLNPTATINQPLRDVNAAPLFTLFRQARPAVLKQALSQFCGEARGDSMRDIIELRARSAIAVVGWIVVLSALGSPSGAAETVTVTFPATASFTVTNGTAITTGAPNPQTYSYSSAALNGGRSLYVSVKANAASFTRPAGAGTAIPCGNVTWTITSALNGAGSAGTLSTAYTLVYTSNANPNSGNVRLRWRLAALPAGVYAGSHTLSMTWKLESL